MGREVRMVPANWEHPKDSSGKFRPLADRDYDDDAADFMEMSRADGLQAAVEHWGAAPNELDYMPAWPEERLTHFMMYENTSEGTPISPSFAAPEELARWLADSACGPMTATYEQWLPVCQRGGSAPSMVMENGVIRSGVEAMAEHSKKEKETP